MYKYETNAMVMFYCRENNDSMANKPDMHRFKGTLYRFSPLEVAYSN